MKTNQITLIGFAGKNIEISQIDTKKMGKISLAVNENYKRGEEWITKTQWFSIIIWNVDDKKEALTIKKGDKLKIDGKLRVNI